MIKHTDFHKKHENFTTLAYKDDKMLPDRYVLVLTNQCNLRCEFCFQDKNKLSTNLTTDDWLKFINELPEYARVTLTGGEPFMFKGFKEVFNKAVEKHACNIISNGLLLNDETIDLLLSNKNFKVLSVSLEDRYNKNRGVKLEKWKKTEQQIKKFVKLKNERNLDTVLDIKTVVLDDNAEDLYDMFLYAKEELQCDTHAFQFLKGSPMQHSDKMYHMDAMFEKSYAYKYEKFDIIKEQLIKISKYNLDKTFVHPQFIELKENEDFNKLDIINEKEIKKEKFQFCKFPWSSVHINYDGNLFPCMSISMGNIKEKSLNDIIFGKKFTEFKNILKKDGLVQGCNRCGWIRLKNA